MQMLRHLRPRGDEATPVTPLLRTGLDVHFEFAF
jgi:hypothetical protein